MIAWVQKDLKRLLAYSSFSHLGLCVLGLLAMDQIGAQGSLLYMVNHGLSTGAMFLLAGMIFDRFATHDRTQMGGLAKGRCRGWRSSPVLFAMSSIGLPGLNGFVSEILCLLGAFGIGRARPRLVLLRASHAGAVVRGRGCPRHGAGGRCTCWGMVNGLLFGPAKVPASRGSVPAGDLSGRELAILSPLAVLVVVLGLFPGLVLQSTAVSVEMTLRPAAVRPDAPIMTPNELTSAAPAAVTLPAVAVAR